MLLETSEEVGTGWIPPLPDFRDYTEASKEVTDMTKKLGISLKASPTLPDKVDWPSISGLFFQ